MKATVSNVTKQKSGRTVNNFQSFDFFGKNTASYSLSRGNKAFVGKTASLRYFVT
jgi:hypothetical protein